MRVTVAGSRFAATTLVAVLLPAVLLSGPLAGPAIAAPASFEVVKGSWTGGGALNFKDGRHETLSCNAYYTNTSNGSALTTALRCSGPSGKFELRSNLSYAGGKVSGNWEERTYNASGEASGTLTEGKLSLNIRGGVAGSITVDFTAANQTVSIAIASAEVPVKTMHFDMKRQ
jgi:hypothetical protein